MAALKEKSPSATNRMLATSGPARPVSKGESMAPGGEAQGGGVESLERVFKSSTHGGVNSDALTRPARLSRSI
jgi:hypothetical protein